MIHIINEKFLMTFDTKLLNFLPYCVNRLMVCLLQHSGVVLNKMTYEDLQLENALISTGWSEVVGDIDFIV